MTGALMRCLLAVAALSEAYDKVASKDIAHLLGVCKPTIHNTLASLQERGLVDKERYGDVKLTEAGRRAAETLSGQRDNLTLLMCRLGLEPAEAAHAAIMLLGGLNEKSIAALCTAEVRTRCPAAPRAEPANEIAR